jgi:hypothetical protein
MYVRPVPRTGIVLIKALLQYLSILPVEVNMGGGEKGNGNDSRFKEEK